MSHATSRARKAASHPRIWHAAESQCLCIRSRNGEPQATLLRGSLFNGHTAAEGAKHFSRSAFTALSPEAQDAHSWTCDACPKSERARRIFGTAVLKDNARGAARADPPLRICYALVPSVGRTRSRASECSSSRLRTLSILQGTLSILKSPREQLNSVTHLFRWRRLP